jgi:hypothetical protein
MQFDGATKLYRKSGFGLHRLRNRYRAEFGFAQAPFQLGKEMRHGLRVVPNVRRSLDSLGPPASVSVYSWRCVSAIPMFSRFARSPKLPNLSLRDSFIHGASPVLPAH